MCNRIQDGMEERQDIISLYHWDCPFCGQINDYEDTECTECGEYDRRIPAAGMKCHKCGKNLSKTDHLNLCKAKLHTYDPGDDPCEIDDLLEGVEYFKEEQL